MSNWQMCFLIFLRFFLFAEFLLSMLRICCQSGEDVHLLGLCLFACTVLGVAVCLALSGTAYMDLRVKQGNLLIHLRALNAFAT